MSEDIEGLARELAEVYARVTVSHETAWQAVARYVLDCYGPLQEMRVSAEHSRALREDLDLQQPGKVVRACAHCGASAENERGELVHARGCRKDPRPDVARILELENHVSDLRAQLGPLAAKVEESRAVTQRAESEWARLHTFQEQLKALGQAVANIEQLLEPTGDDA